MAGLLHQESESTSLLRTRGHDPAAAALGSGQDQQDIVGGAFGSFGGLPDISKLKVKDIGREFFGHQSLAEQYLHLHIETLDKIASAATLSYDDDDDGEPWGPESVVDEDPDCMPNLMARLKYSRDSAISDLIRMEKIFLHGRNVYDARPSPPPHSPVATFLTGGCTLGAVLSATAAPAAKVGLLTGSFGVAAIGFAAAGLGPRVWHDYQLSHLDDELSRIRQMKRKFADGTITPTATRGDSRDDLSKKHFYGFDYLQNWLKHNEYVDYDQFIPAIPDGAGAGWNDGGGRVVEEE